MAVDRIPRNDGEGHHSKAASKEERTHQASPRLQFGYCSSSGGLYKRVKKPKKQRAGTRLQN